MLNNINNIHYYHMQYEPLELCLHKGIINEEQYESAVWFTNKYFQNSKEKHNGSLSKDIKAFKKLCKALMKVNAYSILIDICIYKIYPPFLERPKKNWTVYKDFDCFLYGLEMISEIK